MIRGHDRPEPRLLRLFTPPEQLRRMELLEHRRVAYGTGSVHVAPFGRAKHFSISARYALRASLVSTRPVGRLSAFQHFSLRVRKSLLTGYEGGAAAVLTSEGTSLSVLKC